MVLDMDLLKALLMVAIKAQVQHRQLDMVLLLVVARDLQELMWPVHHPQLM